MKLKSSLRKRCITILFLITALLGLMSLNSSVFSNTTFISCSTTTGSIANWSTIELVINGSNIGTKNQTYTYILYATDADNDFLQYTIDWGDGTQNTSMFLPNSTTWSVSHAWSASGKYQIIAQATDNNTFSEQTTMDVFIDVSFITTLGFLFDTDDDGLFDSFYINSTGGITSVQRTRDGSYYLDTDDDGKWNYLYNPNNGSLTALHSNVTTIENPWFFIIIITVAVLIIACIVYLYKKKYF